VRVLSRNGIKSTLVQLVPGGEVKCLAIYHLLLDVQKRPTDLSQITLPCLYFTDISKAPSLAFLFGSQGMMALQKLVSTLIMIDYLAI